MTVAVDKGVVEIKVVAFGMFVNDCRADYDFSWRWQLAVFDSSQQTTATATATTKHWIRVIDLEATERSTNLVCMFTMLRTGKTLLSMCSYASAVGLPHQHSLHASSIRAPFSLHFGLRRVFLFRVPSFSFLFSTFHLRPFFPLSPFIPKSPQKSSRIRRYVSVGQWFEDCR